MTARSAAAIGSGLAAVGIGAIVMSWGALTPAWPAPPTTSSGAWIIGAVSALPVGSPEIRSGLASACCAVLAAAGLAALLVHRGHAPVVAASSTLALGLVSYGDHLAGAHLPVSLATLLTVAATAAASGKAWAKPLRLASAAGLVCAAASLAPAVAAVVPLVVARAAGASRRARALAGVAGAASAAWGLDMVATPANAPLGPAVLGQTWVWPALLAMASGAIAPLWGGRAAVTAAAGTVVAVAALAAGHDASALVVFPTVLLADGVGGLLQVGPRARSLLAVTVMLVSLGEISLWTTPDTWRLLAWRDAVERAVPAGTRILTGSRAVEALAGPLFRGRPSRLALVLDRRTAASAGPARYGIGVPGVAAQARGVSPVPLSYAGLDDFVSRLPPRTVVALAAPAGDEAALAALRRIGHEVTPAAGTIVAAGMVGHQPVDGLLRGDEGLHVLLADRLTLDGAQSPTDFELRTTADSVSLLLRGRLVASGHRGGALAIRPGGPLVEAITDAMDGIPWSLRLAGLEVWRETP